MLTRLPDRIDLKRFIKQQMQLAGYIPVAKMQRLYPEPTKDDHYVWVEIELGRDAQGIRFIQGSASVELVLTCQRCLESVVVVLKADICLGLIEHEAQEARLPPHYEPLLVVADTLSLVDIIEDELILAMPLVVVHETSVCKISMQNVTK